MIKLNIYDFPDNLRRLFPRQKRNLPPANCASVMERAYNETMYLCIVNFFVMYLFSINASLGEQIWYTYMVLGYGNL